MSAEKHRTASCTAPSADEEFIALRRRFQLRLHDERARLAELTDALVAGTGTAVFGDIAKYAHRLRGAALVFGFSAIAAAAMALELAADDANLEHPSPGRRSTVESKMRDLSTALPQPAAASGRSARWDR